MIAMTAEQVHECLADAGCDEELIKQFETCQGSGVRRNSCGCLGIVAASCWKEYTRNRRNWICWII